MPPLTSTRATGTKHCGKRGTCAGVADTIGGIPYSLGLLGTRGAMLTGGQKSSCISTTSRAGRNSGWVIAGEASKDGSGYLFLTWPYTRIAGDGLTNSEERMRWSGADGTSLPCSIRP